MPSTSRSPVDLSSVLLDILNPQNSLLKVLASYFIVVYDLERVNFNFFLLILNGVTKVHTALEGLRESQISTLIWEADKNSYRYQMGNFSRYVPALPETATFRATMLRTATLALLCEIQKQVQAALARQRLQVVEIPVLDFDALLERLIDQSSRKPRSTDLLEKFSHESWRGGYKP